MVEGYEWVFILNALGMGLGVLMMIREGWTMVKERRAGCPPSEPWTPGARRAPIRVQGSARAHRHRDTRARRP